MASTAASTALDAKFVREFMIKDTSGGHFMKSGLFGSINSSYDEENFSETFKLTFTLTDYSRGTIECNKVFHYTAKDIKLLAQCALDKQGDPVLSNGRIFADEMNSLIDEMNGSRDSIDISDFNETNDKWIIAILGAIYNADRTAYCNYVRRLKFLSSEMIG